MGWVAVRLGWGGVSRAEKERREHSISEKNEQKSKQGGCNLHSSLSPTWQVGNGRRVLAGRLAPLRAHDSPRVVVPPKHDPRLWLVLLGVDVSKESLGTRGASPTPFFVAAPATRTVQRLSREPVTGEPSGDRLFHARPRGRRCCFACRGHGFLCVVGRGCPSPPPACAPPAQRILTTYEPLCTNPAPLSPQPLLQ